MKHRTSCNYLAARFLSVSHARKQVGLSLIELMVALTLGLFIVASTLQVFVGSRQSFNIIQAQSAMQEAARFGFYFIGMTTRHAGYLNAGPMENRDDLFASELVNKFNAAVASSNSTVTANPYIDNTWASDGTFFESAVVMGTDNFNGASTGVPVMKKTDSLSLRLQGEGVSGEETMFDCEGVGIDQDTTATVTFFIGDDKQLYCKVDARPAVALVSGIENMQILYGVASNPAGKQKSKFFVDKYSTASVVSSNSNWPKVMSVRVGLLASSPDNKPLDAIEKKYDLLDVHGLSFSDGEVRQIFTQTIALRGNLSN